jgi:hypothetical protein
MTNGNEERRVCELLRVRFVLPFIASLLGACASTSPPIPQEKEFSAMTTPGADNPHLNAEEISKRFLKLVEGLGSREDLNLERVEEVTGLSLQRVNGKNDYVYYQKLTEGWLYELLFYPEKRGGERGVRLEFHHPEDRVSNMAAVCALDFDHHDNALKAMGFLANPRYGEIGELLSWEYTKFNKSDGTVGISILIIPQNIVAGEAGRLCVKLIHAELK